MLQLTSHNMPKCYSLRATTCQNLVPVWVTKQACTHWVPHQLMLNLNMKGDWWHDNDYSLTTNAKVMIFCTEMSQVTRVRRITMTQNQKGQSPEYHYPTSPREKYSRPHLLQIN